MENKIFVSYKPKGVVSNHFLGRIKRKYGVKKAGFSGTLDPFASGVLIIAFGQFTKLFRFLKKTPKTYRATLWIGAKSDTLDIEGIDEVKNVMPFHPSAIDIIFNSLKGEVKYTPPKFCAKKVDGKRAYRLARADEEFTLKEELMQVYDIKLLYYMHPFLSFEVSVSEGAYVRSLGEIIAKKLGFCGALTSLERVREGEFRYENEKALNPTKYLNVPKNVYLGDETDIKLGKKLKVDDFEIQKDGDYLLQFDDEFAIIKIKDDTVKYELNKVKLC